MFVSAKTYAMDPKEGTIKAAPSWVQQSLGWFGLSSKRFSCQPVAKMGLINSKWIKMVKPFRDFMSRQHKDIFTICNMHLLVSRVFGPAELESHLAYTACKMNAWLHGFGRLGHDIFLLVFDRFSALSFLVVDSRAAPHCSDLAGVHSKFARKMSGPFWRSGSYALICLTLRHVVTSYDVLMLHPVLLAPWCTCQTCM